MSEYVCQLCGATDHKETEWGKMRVVVCPEVTDGEGMLISGDPGHAPPKGTPVRVYSMAIDGVAESVPMEVGGPWRDQ